MNSAATVQKLRKEEDFEGACCPSEDDVSSGKGRQDNVIRWNKEGSEVLWRMIVSATSNVLNCGDKRHTVYRNVSG